METERCGVKCAHQDDVHDCGKCSKHMAFDCAPLCEKCPKEGYDTCQCPVKRSLHTRCVECREVMFVLSSNPDVVYCGCSDFQAPKN